MRALLIAAALLLSSCALFDRPVRTSTSFNGQSFQSMDMTDPHFYMDDDAAPSSNRAPSAQPIPRYGIDGYCGSCRARGGWAY
jgi:hypothetical protein